tara:strand:- start:19711 stop:21342 length:1632 start_codon:yes stop_codon:yes gene_type:complete
LDLFDNLPPWYSIGTNYYLNITLNGAQVISIFSANAAVYRIAVFVCILSASLLAGAPSMAQSVSFTLSGVRFTESVYLDDRELQSAVRPYVDRPITFADVQSMIQDVQALYTAAGVFTGRVVLLPQDVVNNGVLRLDLVEANVADIEQVGLGRTRPEFIRKNISIVEGEKPNYENLERDLRIFEISHGFIPQIAFKKGSKSATTDVSISGTPPDGPEYVFSLDNFGTEATGDLRASVFFRYENLSGWRDTLSAQLQASEGTVSGSVGYSRPMFRPGGRGYTTLSYSESSVISGGFSPVRLESNNLTGTIGYSFPFRIKPDSNWTADFSLLHQQGESQLVTLNFQDTTVTALTASAGYSRLRNERRLSFGFGLRAGSADTVETSLTEGSFTLAFGDVAYARRLGKGAILDATLRMQLAPDQNLPVSQLMSAGGITSVRGYPNNVRSGDSGAIFRAQISRAQPWGQGNAKFYPFGFVDGAAILPFRTTGSAINSDQDLLVSAGFGVQAQINKRYTALLTIAQPLKETLGFSDLGTKIYFGLDAKF